MNSLTNNGSHVNGKHTPAPRSPAATVASGNTDTASALLSAMIDALRQSREGRILDAEDTLAICLAEVAAGV
jgi:hypothetical protein